MRLVALTVFVIAPFLVCAPVAHARKADAEEKVDCERPPNTKKARWQCARRVWGVNDVHSEVRECGPWCAPKVLSAARERTATDALVERIKKREGGSLWLEEHQRAGKELEFFCMEFVPPQSHRRLLICPVDGSGFCGTGGCPVYFLSQRHGKAVEIEEDFALMFYTPGREELESGRAYFGTVSSGGDSVSIEEQYLWKGYLNR